MCVIDALQLRIKCGQRNFAVHKVCFQLCVRNNSQARQARSFILLIHVIYWRSFAANACFNKRWHDYRTLLCLSLAFAFVCVLDIELTVSLSLSLYLHLSPSARAHCICVDAFFLSAPHCSILAILLIFIWFELSISTRHIPIRKERLFMVTTTTSASSLFSCYTLFALKILCFDLLRLDSFPFDLSNSLYDCAMFVRLCVIVIVISWVNDWIYDLYAIISIITHV